MNNVVFITLLATGFAVGFLHAIIPTHWLPFVVAARTQRWTKIKTLTVTGFAGVGHVIFTTALGVLIVWGGMAINSRIGNAFPFLAGGALKGGRVVADWPGLKAANLHDGRDLKPTTDLRAVLKGVLRDHVRVGDKALASTVFPDSAGVKAMTGLVA